MSDCNCNFQLNNLGYVTPPATCCNCSHRLSEKTRAKLAAYKTIETLMAEHDINLPTLCDTLMYHGRTYPTLMRDGVRVAHSLPTAINNLLGIIDELLRPAGGLNAVKPTTPLGKTLTWTKVAMCKMPDPKHYEALNARTES
jgi:hypothetical protein